MLFYFGHVMPVSFLNLEGARLEVAEYAEISINNII
jgi:hypothetical protein